MQKEKTGVSKPFCRDFMDSNILVRAKDWEIKEEDLNAISHARDQVILVLFNTELLGSSWVQVVILDKVICAHTQYEYSSSDNILSLLLTYQFYQLDFVMQKILQLSGKRQYTLFNQQKEN